MYLIYIDESGKPDYEDTENDFVLSAVIIHESRWKEIDDDVKRLKKKHFPNRDPRDVELHAIDILNHKKAFKSMTVPVRLEILTDVIDLITGIDCTIISVLIKKDLIQNKKLDPNMIAIEFLFERICYFLDVKNRDNVENDRFEECGLMLFDSVNDKYDNKIRAKLRLLFESGTKFEKNNYLIEDPLFVNSEYRHLSQLADCVAYCVKKRFRENEPEESHELFKSYYDRLENKFLKRYSKSKGYGIKIYPYKNL